MQRPLLLFMWGAAGHPVWVAHEMVFGTSSTCIFLQRLDKCHCGKAKSHVRPDSVTNNDENVDWDCDYQKQNNVILKG